jgi:hypothetical protein
MTRRHRFRLDQAAFAVFAAEALHRYRYNNIDGEGQDPGEGWELDPGWDLDTVDRDGLARVADLVYYAILEGVIAVPAGLDLDLVISAGDYGEHMYDWRVTFEDEARFSLSLPYRREFKNLGWNEGWQPDGAAEQNAWWVIYEGAQEANRLLAGYRRWHGRLRPPMRHWHMIRRAAARRRHQAMVRRRDGHG